MASRSATKKCTFFGICYPRKYFKAFDKDYKDCCTFLKNNQYEKGRIFSLSFCMNGIYEYISTIIHLIKNKYIVTIARGLWKRYDYDSLNMIPFFRLKIEHKSFYRIKNIERVIALSFFLNFYFSLLKKKKTRTRTMFLQEQLHNCSNNAYGMLIKVNSLT